RAAAAVRAEPRRGRGLSGHGLRPEDVQAADGGDGPAARHRRRTRRIRAVKIWLLSDLHFEFEKWLRPLARELPDADVAVVPGDVLNGCANSVEYLAREFAGRMPVVFVAGNHEFY